MEVAVAGVEHVDDVDAVARRDLVDLLDDFGESRPRHDRVVEVIVRLDLRHGAECSLSPLPEDVPLGIVGGGADVRDTSLTSEFVDPGHVGRHLARLPDAFDQQRGCCVGRQAGMEPGLDRDETELVHHLDGGRDDAIGDDVAHELSTVGDRVELHQHRRDIGGFCIRRTQIFVATPNIPSDPTNAPRRSSPSGSGSSPPSVVIDPSGRTTSTPRTWALVTPSARQCGPPELFATLPPIEHVC